MTELHLGALILAAGLSSRMQGFKPLQSLRGRTFLNHAIKLFEINGVADIVTVVGHRWDELIPLINKTGSRWVINNQYHDGMFSSIQIGAGKLHKRCDAFFLLPVDMPLVAPKTLTILVDAWRKHPHDLVFYPTYQSHRGHPPLIAGSLIDPLLGYAGDGGMRLFLRQFEERAVQVPVADPYILFDIDTEEDLHLANGMKEE